MLRIDVEKFSQYLSSGLLAGMFEFGGLLYGREVWRAFREDFVRFVECGRFDNDHYIINIILNNLDC